MTVMRMLAQREILSESNLHKALINNLGCCRTLEPEKVLEIGPSEVGRFTAAWRAGMDRQVSRLVRSAASTLDDLPVGCLYENLDDKNWQIAAQVCEIFRNPEISKNAGRLDTKALQRKVHERLVQEAPFSLALGWGQPKRSAGGLKALGPLADLAEMYAIRRLLIISRAISEVARKPVGMTVLTGGSRFFEAFFTRPAVTEAYDSQRQEIADVLGGANTMTFRAYADLVGDGSHSAIVGAREKRFRESLDSVTDDMILSKFGTILLNVDWDHLLAPDPADRHHSPHGIPLPSSVDAWLRERDDAASRRLIRAAIVGLTSPKHQADWLASLDDDDVFEDALSFVQSVAWESTRKYIALHLMDSNDEASAILDQQGTNALRLTVHEKSNRRDMPAIFTLGHKGGNLLSQHVLAGVMKRGSIVFESHAELQQRDVSAVRLKSEITADDYPLFGWLARTRQPLCFVEDAAGDATDLLCNAGGE